MSVGEQLRALPAPKLCLQNTSVNKPDGGPHLLQANKFSEMAFLHQSVYWMGKNITTDSYNM